MNISDERLSEIQGRMWMDEELALMSCDLVEARAQIARLSQSVAFYNREGDTPAGWSAECEGSGGVWDPRPGDVLARTAEGVRVMRSIGSDDDALLIERNQLSAQLKLRDRMVDILQSDILQRAEEADVMLRDWQSKAGTESESSGDEDEAGFYEGKVEGGIEILNVFMGSRSKLSQEQS